MAAIIFCFLRGQKYHAALQLLLKLLASLSQSLDQLPYPALVTLTVNRYSLTYCCPCPCPYSSRPLLLAQCRVQITKPGKIPACGHPAYRRQKHSPLHSAILCSFPILLSEYQSLHLTNIYPAKNVSSAPRSRRPTYHTAPGHAAVLLSAALFPHWCHPLAANHPTAIF